jgi:hypothetical protein
MKFENIPVFVMCDFTSRPNFYFSYCEAKYRSFLLFHRLFCPLNMLFEWKVEIRIKQKIRTVIKCIKNVYTVSFYFKFILRTFIVWTKSKVSRHGSRYQENKTMFWSDPTGSLFHFTFGLSSPMSWIFLWCGFFLSDSQIKCDQGQNFSNTFNPIQLLRNKKKTWKTKTIDYKNVSN